MAQMRDLAERFKFKSIDVDMHTQNFWSRTIQWMKGDTIKMSKADQ